MASPCFTNKHRSHRFLMWMVEGLCTHTLASTSMGTDTYHWALETILPSTLSFNLVVVGWYIPMSRETCHPCAFKTTHPAVELLWHKATQQDSIAHHLCHLCKRKLQSGWCSQYFRCRKKDPAMLPCNPFFFHGVSQENDYMIRTMFVVVNRVFFWETGKKHHVW